MTNLISVPECVECVVAATPLPSGVMVKLRVYDECGPVTIGGLLVLRVGFLWYKRTRVNYMRASFLWVSSRTITCIVSTKVLT